MRYGKLWILLFSVVVGSLAILGYYGCELDYQTPPVPQRVVTSQGQVLFTQREIKDGQNVWQSMGGQEVGSVWGYGAYVAPDWSADRLHRESEAILNRWARSEGKSYAELSPERQAGLRVRLNRELRTNTYDRATGDLTISPDRAAAIAEVSAPDDRLFGNDPALVNLREAYAIPPLSVKTAERRHLMNAFFFRTSWVCATDRAGSSITYTNNWSAESLIDNTPGTSVIVGSLASIVVLTQRPRRRMSRHRFQPLSASSLSITKGV